MERGHWLPLCMLGEPHMLAPPSRRRCAQASQAGQSLPSAEHFVNRAAPATPSKKASHADGAGEDQLRRAGHVDVVVALPPLDVQRAAGQVDLPGSMGRRRLWLGGHRLGCFQLEKAWTASRPGRLAA